MTQAEFGIALLITLEVLVFSAIQIRRIRRERLKTARYKLFAVRDYLIRCVADDQVSEDDPTFAFLYEEINALIPKARPLSLRALVVALKESRLVNDAAFRAKCDEAMDHCNDRLRDAAAVFFHTMIDILVMRSFMVRISWHLTHSSVKLAIWCRDCLSVLRRLTAHVFPLQGEAYRLYKGFEDLSVD
jgi:hypothetical protein